jgi:hypothetical protein
VVAELIERKFDIRLGLTAIGALLARLNLTPQKPLQRAYQRDPEAIERWQCVSYPAIARQARMEGGDVFFWDGGAIGNMAGFYMDNATAIEQKMTPRPAAGYLGMRTGEASGREVFASIQHFLRMGFDTTVGAL